MGMTERQNVSKATEIHIRQRNCNVLNCEFLSGAPHVLFFLPSYTHSLQIGINPATLLAVISIFDLLGRVVCGFLVDTNIMPKFLMYSGLIFVAALSIVLLPLFTDAISLFFVLSLYGFGVGGWFLMVPVLLVLMLNKCFLGY
jgi:MFS family permease